MSVPERARRWYVCGGSDEAGCGRWFGINYEDPATGELLWDHHCQPARQLSLFGAVS